MLKIQRFNTVFEKRKRQQKSIQTTHRGAAKTLQTTNGKLQIKKKKKYFVALVLWGCYVWHLSDFFFFIVSVLFCFGVVVFCFFFGGGA